MTEAEWLAFEDPQPMPVFLRGKASDRKLRLFAGACCRSIRGLFFDPRSRRVVEIAEQAAHLAAVGGPAAQPPAGPSVPEAHVGVVGGAGQGLAVGEKATAVAMRVCPGRAAFSLPVAASHRRTTPSLP